MKKQWIFNIEIENEKDFMDHFDNCETPEEAMEELKEDLNMEFAGVYGGIVITGVSQVNPSKDDFSKFMNEPEEPEL